LPGIVIPLLDEVPPPELPLDPLPDPELLELLELLAVPPLELELFDVAAPELLPLRVPAPLLLALPPLLPVPLLPPAGWPLFTGVEAPPLEVPLVPPGGGVNVPSVLGVVDVQPTIETATSAAVPRLIEWMFFIFGLANGWTLGRWDLPRSKATPARAQKENPNLKLEPSANYEAAVYNVR
jgi:hypothetical protein